MHKLQGGLLNSGVRLISVCDNDNKVKNKDNNLTSFKKHLRIEIIKLFISNTFNRVSYTGELSGSMFPLRRICPPQHIQMGNLNLTDEIYKKLIYNVDVGIQHKKVV